MLDHLGAGGLPGRGPFLFSGEQECVMERCSPLTCIRNQRVGLSEVLLGRKPRSWNAHLHLLIHTDVQNINEIKKNQKERHCRLLQLFWELKSEYCSKVVLLSKIYNTIYYLL